MIVITVTIFIVIIYYAHFRRSRKALYELSRKLIDVGGIPILGHTLWFIGGPEKLFKNIKIISEMVQSVSELGKLWIGPHLYIVPFNLDDVQKILDNCLEKDYTYRFLEKWLGNGLFIAPVEIWRGHRRLMIPIFQNKVVDECIDVFGQQGTVLVDRLEEQQGGPEFDIFKYLTPCMLDIVFETAMGEKMNLQFNPDSPYIKARDAVISIIHMRLFKPWMQPDAVFNLTSYARKQNENIKITHTFTHEVLKKKRLALRITDADSTDKGNKDVLQQLLMKNQHFTDQDLRQQIDSITIGGNDTTALVCAYALQLLGCHHEAQRKVYEELKSIFGDSQRSPKNEDLQKMEYLERVLKETMRLYTVVPIIGRKTTKEVKLTSCILPAGVGCAILPFVIHRDKKIWGHDADSFDPDRFTPERCAARHPCAYIPFSFGPRNCFGRHFAMQAMKSILSCVLRRYEINSKGCDRLKIQILLYPVDGHLVTITKR